MRLRRRASRRAGTCRRRRRKGKHRVTLLAVNPPEGSEVRADSILELDVEFHIANFEPEKFFLMPGFQTVGLDPMSPGDSAKGDFKPPQDAIGQGASLRSPEGGVRASGRALAARYAGEPE